MEVRNVSVLTIVFDRRHGTCQSKDIASKVRTNVTCVHTRASQDGAGIKYLCATKRIQFTDRKQNKLRLPEKVRQLCIISARTNAGALSKTFVINERSWSMHL